MPAGSGGLIGPAKRVSGCTQKSNVNHQAVRALYSGYRGSASTDGDLERKGGSLCVGSGVFSEGHGLVYVSPQASRSHENKDWCYSLDSGVLLWRWLALVVCNIHMVASSGRSHLVLP